MMKGELCGKKGYEENKDYGRDVRNIKSISCTFYSRNWIRKERSLKKSPSKEKQGGFEQITVKPERLVGVEVDFPSGLKIILRDMPQQELSNLL
jgi:hypothetical protein